MDKQSQSSLLIHFNKDNHRINLDGTDYICLNDLVKFFPSKRIEDWQRLNSTKEYIKIVDNHIRQNYDHAHVRDHNNAIFTIKGKGKTQGTFAHRYIAIEFLTWLSPEFKLLVIKEWDTWRLQKVQKTEEFLYSELDKKLKIFLNTLENTFITRQEFEETEVDALESFKKLAHMFLDNRNDVKDMLHKFEIRIQILEKEVNTLDGENFKVYIIYSTVTDEYKIGRSHSPITRKKNFQTVEPDIKIIYTITLKSSREAGTLERFLHEKFSHKRVHGEWFKLHEKDLSFIEMLKVYIQDLH